ncbi:hypothetical protein PoB_006498000 [Plakobranchus ocellatus]|uniref:Uncharacterized protein n=1 Tax=Plakobranchus ocellatus TaxID=259542 RepID=A0AAV4D3C5_9GAST|nr:hypothetical protein PoB_006498000 [Plakobranchus ocellatus]
MVIEPYDQIHSYGLECSSLQNPILFLDCTLFTTEVHGLRRPFVGQRFEQRCMEPKRSCRIDYIVISAGPTICFAGSGTGVTTNSSTMRAVQNLIFHARSKLTLG